MTELGAQTRFQAGLQAARRGWQQGPGPAWSAIIVGCATGIPDRSARRCAGCPRPRVVRFDRARRLLQRRVATAGQPELAALAAACGYYDQAHLAREFRALAGCPPSRWLAEEFRNVQAAAT
jgi:Helix-turn-helix domain